MRYFKHCMNKRCLSENLPFFIFIGLIDDVRVQIPTYNTQIIIVIIINTDLQHLCCFLMLFKTTTFVFIMNSEKENVITIKNMIFFRYYNKHKIK